MNRMARRLSPSVVVNSAEPSTPNGASFSLCSSDAPMRQACFTGSGTAAHPHFAVTCNGFGAVEDPYAVPRSLLWGTDRLPFFVAKVAGVFDPAFDHPAVRFARVRTRGIRRRVRSAVDPSG